MSNAADILYRHELIGLEVTVSGVNSNSMRMKGLIIDETRNTFLINEKGVEKKVIKLDSCFMFNLNGTMVEYEGTTLVGRPEDRIKKK
jgi:ribonuclease P protein subunit POP4